MATAGFVMTYMEAGIQTKAQGLQTTVAPKSRAVVGNPELAGAHMVPEEEGGIITLIVTGVTGKAEVTTENLYPQNPKQRMIGTGINDEVLPMPTTVEVEILIVQTVLPWARA